MARIDKLTNYLEDIAIALREKHGDEVIEAYNQSKGFNDNLIAPKDYDYWINELNPKITPNATIKYYECDTEILEGNFVKINENNNIEVANENEYILGIANQDGEIGDTIEVWIPNIVTPYEIKIIKNTGETGNQGFKLMDDNETYQSLNKAMNSYSLAKIKIKARKDIKIIIDALAWTNQTIQCWGILPQHLDQKLKASYEISDINTIQKVHSSSEDDWKTFEFIVPGDNEEHFIDVKYRKPNQNTSANYDDLRWKIKVERI